MTTPLLFSTGAVATRYDVTPRSIERWLKIPALDFPLPIRINGRRYWFVEQLEDWERSRAPRARTSVDCDGDGHQGAATTSSAREAL